MLRKATQTRRMMLAAAAASLAFGSVNAFAATLGAGTGALGATDKPIASCGSGMSFRYTTAFSSGIAGYAVDAIDLSNIPAGCLGQSIQVTFYNGDVVTGAEVFATLPASGQTQSIPIDPSSNT